MSNLLSLTAANNDPTLLLFFYLGPTDWISMGSTCKALLNSLFNFFQSSSAIRKFGKDVAGVALKEWFCVPFQPSIFLLHRLRKKGVVFLDPKATDLIIYLKKGLSNNDLIRVRMLCQFGINCQSTLLHILDVRKNFNPLVIREILSSPTIDLSQGYRDIPFHHLFVITGKIDYLTKMKDMKGVNFQYKDRDNRNLAYWAVAAPQREVELLEFLQKECQVDVNIADKWGMTAAFLAVAHQKLDCVHYLVEQGRIDLNYQNKDGRTLAHECAERGCHTILKYLIQKGIDLSIKTKTSEKETAYDLANIYLQRECLELLKPWKESQSKTAAPNHEFESKANE